MAWYPRATKLELQPESDAQPAIRPTQFIVHSLAAPWDEKRTYEYWRDSTNLESHFGLDYDGSLGQFIGTETRADANAAANRRSDGTGAISIETASNTGATDKWTDAQVEELIRLGVWAHQTHGIPLRLCRSADDPGFGWHKQYSAWNPNGHACPGPARITQFKDVVFPGIVARATGKTTTTQEDTAVTLTVDDLKLLASRDGVFLAPTDAADYSDDPDEPGHYWSLGTHVIGLTTKVRGIEKRQKEMDAKLDAILAALTKEA